MNQYDPTTENIEEVTPAVSEETSAPAPQAASRPVTRRYDKKGRRRGKYAYAAPLGMLISLLSIIGVIAIVVSGIGTVRNATDTTALGEEIYYFLADHYLLIPFGGSDNHSAARQTKLAGVCFETPIRDEADLRKR